LTLQMLNEPTNLLRNPDLPRINLALKAGCFGQFYKENPLKKARDRISAISRLVDMIRLLIQIGRSVLSTGRPYSKLAKFVVECIVFDKSAWTNNVTRFRPYSDSILSIPLVVELDYVYILRL
jgi:hypothetical protein